MLTQSIRNLWHNVVVLSATRIQQVHQPGAVGQPPSPQRGPQPPTYPRPDASCQADEPRPVQAQAQAAPPQPGAPYRTTLTVILSQVFELWIKDRKIVSGPLYCDLDEVDCKALRTLLNAALKPAPEVGPDGKPIKPGLREIMASVEMRAAEAAKTSGAPTT